MICPYCHAENKYDALTCDFCLKELPMTEKRKNEIKNIKKKEKKNKYHNSMIKLIGTILGVIAIIVVIVIAWLSSRG